jgi:MSHA biogenesis protein MshO
MELIIVIIIMGVMSLGIAGFIKLSTQTYLNVTERDELLANARFSVERLNREVRNVLPNSMRVGNITKSGEVVGQCLEFVPIITSTVYTDIAVPPEAVSKTLAVIPFKVTSNLDYTCIDCGDVVMVYPLSDAEVYQDHSDTLGKGFSIENYPASNASEIELKQAVTFSENSPTQRAYIINSPVSYCVDGTANNITRYTNYGFNAVQQLPPNIVSSPALKLSLMALNLSFDNNNLPFSITPASLRRNAVVQMQLNFTRDSEEVLFDNAIHINNIP